MPTSIQTLTEKLISFRSNPGDSADQSKILEFALSQLPDFTIEYFEHNGAKSALVYASQRRPKKFEIILNAHLDVIPGKDHQLVPKIKGTRLYGVGAMDMKAGAACMITIFREVAGALPYPLALQLTTDEEIGGFNGTKYQLEQGVSANFVIAGEPTNLEIVPQAKGILHVKITAKGESAHGAYPWRGNNAILQITRLVDKLEKEFPVPKQDTWATTVNVANIKTTNRSFNKVPDNCTLWLDIRFVPEDAQRITERLRQLLPQGCDIDIIAHEPSMNTSSHDMFVTELSSEAGRILGRPPKLRGANGTSDARHYQAMGCPGVEFGPIGDGIGSDEEWVDLTSLPQYVEILKSFLRAHKPVSISPLAINAPRE
jgi:succinyl-diaminopimelate desuccinylase